MQLGGWSKKLEWKPPLVVPPAGTPNFNNELHNNELHTQKHCAKKLITVGPFQDIESTITHKEKRQKLSGRMKLKC